MSVIDNLITDRTSSDVSRWSELKSKGWSGMTESEKAEWSAGMKGAYKYTDLNRVNEAMVYLQNRLRGYGYLVDVVPPVIEEVEEGTSRLPTGYQEVEYIQSSGTQWVDTGVYPNESTYAQIGISLHGVTGDVILGHQGGDSVIEDNLDWRFFNASGSYYLDIMQSRLKGESVPQNEKLELEIGNNYIKNTQSGENILSGQQVGAFTSSITIKLLKGIKTIVPASIYYLRIYNSTLIRNFVPCKNPSGVAGLYDLENDQFYGNAGTGSFSVGPDVGTPPTITTRPYWAEGDIPTLSQMDQYLQNVSNIRAVLEVLQSTPSVPGDMVDLTYGEANDIERILVDVETVINRVVAGFFRSNAFTVICGNRPLPSSQSNLGRTWDDIDAEALTWDDLDDHGSSWYVIQYGVLKGTAVGIL